MGKHTQTTCANSYTSKAANAVTRSVPSSGRSSQMSTVPTQLVPTMVTLTFSWSASTFTTTRPLAVATCLVPSSWTLSQALWTRSVLAHSAKGHYTEGAELIDSMLDVVRKEAESC